jgi:hypothetical protein
LGESQHLLPSREPEGEPAFVSRFGQPLTIEGEVR